MTTSTIQAGNLPLIPERGIIEPKDFLQKISNLVDYNAIPIVTTNKKISYYNIPAAFDIEVSSFYQDDEKRACMYIWQFGILNWVTYGRTWSEYEMFIMQLTRLLNLSNELLLPVYVHNLAYEFQFMRKHFEWDSVFLIEERKPVRAVSSGLEYRCSLKLSSKSLAKVGEDLTKYHEYKHVGDLDYSLIRTPKTPLTDEELGYCEADIRVLIAYIQEKIETDGDITRIPMTNTGYVRNFCRNACLPKGKDRKSDYFRYRRYMQELTLEPDEYLQLKRAFQGGFTHANAHYFGQILQNVGSFDFTSSYPAVMLSEKFPMTKSRLVDQITSEKHLEEYLNKFCCLFDLELHNVTERLNYDHPISYSKLLWHNKEERRANFAVIDNGRVVQSDLVRITCTEQDYFIYRKFYNWDSMNIYNFRIYQKGYLPKPFVQAILSMYKDKTRLKGIEGEEVNYMISKNMLNSAYGMTVTDIVRDEISYSNADGYKTEEPNLVDSIERYNNGKKRFLFYPWGVWVTAYARRNLFSGICACGSDYVYSDTDSIKVLNPDSHLQYIHDYNRLISAKLNRASLFHRIDPSEFSPLNKKGEPKPIGVWDYEGTYDEFKTLGAKRYLTRKGGDYSLTVAGLHKSKARDYLVRGGKDPFSEFRDGLVVPRGDSGRLTLTYVDEPCSGYVRDYSGRSSEYNELSYIHMEPSDYTMSISDEYEAFIKKLLNIKEDSW